jgi:beta-phosphoglucomutase-like phosphatase (HAD superfamily)
LGIARLAVHIGESAAQSAVAIEDSLAGVRAAKGAGLTCVAVGHSYAKDLLLAAGADLYADHIRSLDVRALEALCSELTR